MRVVLVLVIVALLLSTILAVGGGGSRAASSASGQPPGASGAGSLAGLVFGDPEASGSLTQPVVFSTSFRADAPPDRVELLTRVDGTATDEVREALVQPLGDGSWTATVPSIGFTPPNTLQEFRFRAVDGDDVVLGPTEEFRLVDDRFEWRTLSEGPVTLHWYSGTEEFAQRALRVGVDAIEQAAEMLGVTDVRPVDFFVYDTTEALYGAMGPGTRENVGGQANPLIRTMVGVIRPSDVDSDWVDTLVTHELTHMVFADATDNPYHQPPRWLNEGLAVHLSEGYDVGRRAQVADAAAHGQLIPLSGIAGLFPTTYDRFSLAYAESVSAVDHLIETVGRDALVRLITSYRGGVTDDEAFLAATGADTQDFDDAWLVAQGVTRPEPYGPRPAPRGPEPSDWQSDPTSSTAVGDSRP